MNSLHRLLISVIVSAAFTSGLYIFGEKPLPPARLPVLGSQSPTHNFSVTQKINFGSLSPTLISTPSATANDTVLTLLMRTLPQTQVKSYSLGILVESIENVKNGTAGKHWQYFMNGFPSPTSPDRYALKSGDVIEWKFIPN